MCTNSDFKPKFHFTRHVTTSYLADAFWHRKKSWRDVSRLSVFAVQHARRDKHDTSDTQQKCKLVPRSVMSLVAEQPNKCFVINDLCIAVARALC